MKPSRGLLFVLGFLPLTYLANADTLYTSAGAFAAATSGTSTVTFGTTAYPGGFLNAGAFGFPYTVPTGGGNVTFTVGTPATFLNVNNASFYAPPTYPDGNYLIAFGSTPSDVVTISFPSSTAVSLDLGGGFFAENGIGIALSDGFTTTFDAPSFIRSGNPLDFIGFTSTTPITSITLTLPGDPATGEFSAIDNVQFGTATVTPEPSTLLLLGTGIAGIFGAARRRYRPA